MCFMCHSKWERHSNPVSSDVKKAKATPRTRLSGNANAHKHLLDQKNLPDEKQT